MKAKTEGFATANITSEYDSIPISIIHSVKSAEKPKAIVQIVHGMCEHKERYLDFMTFLAEKGYYCIIHDHRGHGESVKSAEDLGYFYTGGYRAMVEDTKAVSVFAKKDCGEDIPFFLLGHSMGSMIVRSYTKLYDKDIDKLIVCGSPSANPAAGIGKMLARLIGSIKGDRHRPAIIQKISFGAFNKNFKGEESPNAWVCSDPEVIKAYDNDPLCNYTFTVNGFHNLFSLMQDCYGTDGWAMNRPGLPILFISGAEDPCLTNEKSFLKAVDNMKKAGYKNVSYRLYPGMRHEILNEKDKFTVWNDVADFISR